MLKKTFSFIVLLLSLFGTSASADTVNIYVVPTITDDYILPTTSISSSYISSAISMKASPGEFESASFVVRPNTPVSGMTLDISNLTGGSGTIPASNIDIRVVKVWYQAGANEWYRMDGTRVFTPELLLKDDSLVSVQGTDNYLKVNGSYVLISSSTSGIAGLSSQDWTPASEFPVQDASTLQPVTIDANTNKQFWITLKVPSGTAAGTYSGVITLKTGATTLGQLALTLQVWPITLADPYITYTMFYLGSLKSSDSPNGYTSAYISAQIKSAQQLQAEYRNMRDHGIATPTLNQSSNVNIIMPMRQSAGFSNNPLYYFGLAPANCTIDPTTFQNNVAAFKSQVAAYSTDIYFYMIDEADINSSACRGLIQAIHNAGGKAFNSMGWSLAQPVADVLDMANIAYGLNSSYSLVYHQYNHKIFSYNNPQLVPEK
ncbi:MAG: hypothetical protein WC539_10710, partial [Nitrospirota bacterium]